MQERSLVKSYKFPAGLGMNKWWRLWAFERNQMQAKDDGFRGFNIAY